MLFSAYVFALVLGGILLGASIVMGGETGDGDTPALGEAEAAADGAGELVALGQQGLATTHGDAHGALDGVLTSFLSLRFWTFFLAFTGLAGVVFELGALVTPAWLGATIAAGVGLVSGQSAVAIFHALGTSESSTVAEASDFVGRSARAQFAFARGEIGKIRLDVKGTTVDLLATTDELTPFQAGDEVLIVAMQDANAVVARSGIERRTPELPPASPP
jgi:membrane protein implicated in regulation of membrane protease activity